MRQGRVPILSIVWAAAAGSTALVIAYLSLRRPQFYSEHRYPLILAWRVGVVTWPTFIVMMSNFPMKLIDNFPMVALLISSSLITNLKTTIIAPTPLKESFWLTILVSLRQLYDQMAVCRADAPSSVNPAVLTSRIWASLSSLAPLDAAVISPTDVLPHCSQCLLVFASAEICVLIFCWWTMRYIDMSSRVWYLRRLPEEALEMCSGRREYTKLLLYDPLISAIRALCLCLSAVSSLWLIVLFVSIKLNDQNQ